MLLPNLQNESSYREVIDSFGGYNHNLRIANNEFFDQKNITSDYYPVMSQREKRGTVAELSDPMGMCRKDYLAYIDGTNLYYNGLNVTTVGFQLSTAENMLPKHMVSMGAYIVIFPDNVMYNTADGSWTHLENTVTTSGNVTFSMCQADGASLGSYPASPVEPSEPDDKDYWLDTSSTPHVMKQYASSTGVWTVIPTTYVKIACNGIGNGFDERDGVEISGCTAAGTADFNNTSILIAKDANYIVIIGILDETVTQNTPVTVARKVPKMDFVTESENRIWGCFFGVQNGQTLNEIYACALGDPKNWRKYQGISTDSYAVSLGANGQFTGAVTHLGYPLFFREDCIHKVYGTMPSNYQVQTTACRGVQRGSYKSLCIVDETLFYKSVSDVCAYGGSLPETISIPLGNLSYSDAVGGSVNGKYYISMKGSDNKWNLFCYDVRKGVWNREDEVHVFEFASVANDLYYIDADTGFLMSPTGVGTKEGGFDWYADTGIIGLEQPDNKYISRITVRMSLSVGSSVSIYIQYDSDEGWEHLCTFEGRNMQSFTVPIRPRRCDHFRLRMSGFGEIKFYAMSKTLEQGSDI